MSHRDLELRPIGDRASTPSRWELLAAALEAESIRSGDRIGYQSTLIEILQCLDEAASGRITDRMCADAIWTRIARAVDIDPFDRRTAD